jgi:hypothetical protein
LGDLPVGQIKQPISKIANSGRWMFGRIFGLDGSESYRELRLELLCCLTV